MSSFRKVYFNLIIGYNTSRQTDQRCKICSLKYKYLTSYLCRDALLLISLLFTFGTDLPFFATKQGTETDSGLFS